MSMSIKGWLVAGATVAVASTVAIAGTAAAAFAKGDVAGIEEGADATEAGTSPVASWLGWRSSFTFRPVIARPVVRTYWSQSYVRVAPPMARREFIGVAPSSRHLWTPGYHRWTGARYTWVPGTWQLRRTGHAYVAGHWTHIGGYWHFVPGHWR